MKIFLFLALIATPLYSSTMTITSESASWNKEKGVLVLKGNVGLKWDSITLKAPIVRLKGEMENPEKIIASGNVIVLDRERDATIKAETIEILLKEKRAYCKGGVLINYKNRVIFGNSLDYTDLKNMAELKGSCTMTEDDRLFEAETMKYFLGEEHIEFEGNVRGRIKIR